MLDGSPIHRPRSATLKEQPTARDSVDQAIRQIAEGPPDLAVVELTAVANRAIIELHKIARQEANSRRGGADWGPWARLANAVRSGVLQVAAIRDSLKSLPTDPQETAPPQAQLELDETPS